MRTLCAGTCQVELSRPDLAAVLRGAAAGDAEFLFGDSITALTQDGERVHASFERAADRSFELVADADGVHSNVRRCLSDPNLICRSPRGIRRHAAAAG
jgi:2-polyprenyl-6-methoxyphenol hydroxylase-like FAD-dependent oxidoreductase